MNKHTRQQKMETYIETIKRQIEYLFVEFSIFTKNNFDLVAEDKKTKNSIQID